MPEIKSEVQMLYYAAKFQCRQTSTSFEKISHKFQPYKKVLDNSQPHFFYKVTSLSVGKLKVP